MKNYLITIWNDLNGNIDFEGHVKVNNENDLKSAIIAILQKPEIEINVNNNILVQYDEEEE